MPGAERVRSVLPRNAHGIAVAGGPSPGLAVPFAIRPFTAPLTTTAVQVKHLIITPFSRYCGTVAEWLWRHV